VGTGGEEACGAPDKALVQNGRLQEVLGNSPGLQVVVIGLADSAQETHRARPAKVELEHAKHEPLRLKDLFAFVPTVDHVLDLLYGRAVNLLILGGQEDGGSPDELQLAKRDDLD